MSDNDWNNRFGTIVESISDFSRLVEEYNILHNASTRSTNIESQLTPSYQPTPPPPPPPPSPSTTTTTTTTTTTSSSLTPFINSVCECDNKECINIRNSFITDSDTDSDTESYLDDDPFNYDTSRLIIKVKI